MPRPPQGPNPTAPDFRRLLPYVADLELEVDRLRRQGQFVQQEVREALRQIRRLCAEAPGGDSPLARLAEVGRVAADLAGVVRDLQEPPGYHPAHDQVIAIAVRPLIEQVFRWQQRLENAAQVKLHLELESEHVEWFPGRLRHVLDNLLSNALKYRDPEKAEGWVRVGLRVSPEGYELRVEDNGLGLPPGAGDRVFELFYRAAPARAAGLGVARFLVEQ